MLFHIVVKSFLMKAFYVHLLYFVVCNYITAATDCTLFKAISQQGCENFLADFSFLGPDFTLDLCLFEKQIFKST